MARDAQSHHEAKAKELRDEYRNNINTYDDRTKRQLIEDIYQAERVAEQARRMKELGVKFRKS